MNNRVLAFMDNVHRFESENDLFALRDEKGTLYWDIVRLQVLIVLFYSYEKKTPLTAAPVPPAGNKVFRLMKWLAWLFVNEWNFFFTLRRKPYLFLKISRFYDAAHNRSYDAVADELYNLLQNDAVAVETFKNAQTDITRFGHRYQTFHAYTLRQWYKRRKFVPGKTYDLSVLLKERFPETAGENWDQLIQETLLEYQAEYRFMSRLFRRVRPKAMFFSGGAKGTTAAGRDLGIATIEIQHSPLNRADLFYSYPTDIDYSAITTLPEYLLVNSEKWQTQLYYPPTFVNVGSGYFFDSSRPGIVPVRNTVLFVSDPQNHDKIRQMLLRLLRTDQFNDRDFVLKLHSAESDRYADTQQFFSDHTNVTVVLNERNISTLLDESCAAFIVYSTVAYQAVQKGVKVFLLKTGYYEGGYDLFDLPNVELVDLDGSAEQLKRMGMETFAPVLFFEPFDPKKLHGFLDTLH